MKCGSCPIHERFGCRGNSDGKNKCWAQRSEIGSAAPNIFYQNLLYEIEVLQGFGEAVFGYGGGEVVGFLVEVGGGVAH